MSQRYTLRSAGVFNGVYYADNHMEVDSEGGWVKYATVSNVVNCHDAQNRPTGCGYPSPRAGQ